MRKTDKKRENQIRMALTEVCEASLKSFSGFQWLTHLVDYSHFPNSLNVVCIFDTNDHLDRFMVTQQQELAHLIQKKLFEIDVVLKKIDSHITYDTEEKCQQYHNGKWAERLKTSDY
ncbi:Fis family transcriptional regulator [Marinomonas algicola]|uniref:Fis family transcriptional regulator n=1 Tax=Marinomonas algicola TaxID=2773454 RepID=UPI00174C63EC|nr:Fis family transcriptional regulator [Marinomonas algicola]